LATKVAKEVVERLLQRHQLPADPSPEDQELVRAYVAQLVSRGSLFQPAGRQQAVWSAVAAGRLPLAPEELVRRVQQVGARECLRRQRVLDRLGDPLGPATRRPQLARQLRLLADWLETNRDHLLETGFPAVSTNVLPWLACRLGRHYYTRVPLVIGAAASEEGPTPYVYQWPNQPARCRQELAGWKPGLTIYQFLWDEQGQPTNGRGQPVGVCEYGLAALSPGLQEAEATALTALREPFFSLKLATIRQLATLLAATTPTDVWTECLPRFVQQLPYERAKELLTRDQGYRRWCQFIALEPELAATDPAACPAGLVAGGLSDLLDVIVHCQLEREQGVWDQAAGDLERLAEELETSDWWTLCVGDYLLAVGEPWREDLDLILDRFCRRLQAAVGHGKELSQRLDADLDQELVETVQFSTGVPHRHSVRFQALASEHLELLRSHLASANQLPSPPFIPVESPPATAPNVIHRGVGAWTLCYAGKRVTLGDLKGLRYIQLLLASPDREIPVLQLTALANQKFFPRSSHSEAQLATDGLEDEGAGSTSPMLDADARRSYEQTVDTCELQLEAAERFGNEADAVVIRESLAAAQQALASAIGKGGRVRTFANERTKAARAVSKCIDYALNKIRSGHRPLYLHLANSLKLGISPCYRPASSVKWELD